jgi:hypothetical protein
MDGGMLGGAAMTAQLIHVRHSDSGMWVVESDDRDAPLSQHGTETEAESPAVARAAVEDCEVLVHDRYARVHFVRQPGRSRRT